MFKNNIKIIAGILVYALIMVGIFTPFSIFEKGEAQKDEIDMAIELIRSAIASALDSTNGWLPIDNGSYPLTNLVDLARTIPIISRISIAIGAGLGICGILDLILVLILIAIDILLTIIFILTFFIPIINLVGVPILLVKFLILKPIIILNIPLVGLGLVGLGLVGLGLSIWGVPDLAEFLLEILEPMLSTLFPTDFLTTIGA